MLLPNCDRYAVDQAVRRAAWEFLFERGGDDLLNGLLVLTQALDALAMRFVTHPFTTQLRTFASFFEGKEPSRPYDVLLAKTHEPQQAMMRAHCYRYFGAKYVSAAEAERELASAVYAVARTKKQTPVKLADCAKRLEAALSAAPLAAEAACEKVGIVQEELRELVSRAVIQDPKSCADLYLTCVKMKPYLRNPKIRIVGVETATHAFLIDEEGTKGSWNSRDSRYTDAFTRATAEEFQKPQFSPKPARILLKKLKGASHAR